VELPIEASSGRPVIAKTVNNPENIQQSTLFSVFQQAPAPLGLTEIFRLQSVISHKDVCQGLIGYHFLIAATLSFDLYS
jgi:hypothetical protein